MEQKVKREKFSSGIGLFFAALSSAVGLGNIWKFPYLVGQNGGGAFLFIYLICICLVGIPVLITEFYIGRKSGKNVVGAMESLSSSSKWRPIGVSALMSSYFIMFFYTTVAGWVYAYIFKCIKGDFKHINLQTSQQLFDSCIINPKVAITGQIIVMIVVCTVLIFGVQKGIEKVTKILMPVLFFLIIVCVIRALTLSGAKEGIEFLFKIDFSKVTITTIIVALGLAFFKLGLGSGSMITYGSYFTEDNNMIGTAIKVALADTLVSILAGLAIFPVVFSFNMKPTTGPGLLFISIPLVFSKIPFGNILLILFFVLSGIAATMAIMSMLQVLVAYYTEERKFSKLKAISINGIIIILVGTLSTLSVGDGAILANIKVFGKTFFDLFDYMSSNLFLPMTGLFISIFVAYFNKKKSIVNELSNKGTLKNNKIINVYYFILKYISIILLLIVFLYSIGIINF